MSYTYEQLNQLFVENNFVEVTFTKKDGTERVLKGTRNFSHIPDEHHPVKGISESEDDGNVVVHTDTSTLKVFDVNAVGWRSIKPETVTLVKIKL